jgi:hypothetical protein
MRTTGTNRLMAAAGAMAVSFWWVPAGAAAQIPVDAPDGPALLPPAISPAEPPAPSRTSIGTVLGNEARRYVGDTAYILTAPIHWDSRTWIEAVAAAAAIAVISHEDQPIENGVQHLRSSTTNSVSSAVTPLGSSVAVGLSVAALGGGLLFKDPKLRDLGRDAVESEVIAAGIVTPLLKWAFGRTRPSQGGDGDEYDAFSSKQSFPSGHATEAFALASVVATRSEGWVVPTVAYGLAAAVGFARMNDQAHYASDVVTGALIGTLVGRSVVHRHTEAPEKQASWTVMPFVVPRGAGLTLHLETSVR